MKDFFIPQSVWSAKLLFSFDLSVKVKAKQEFSTPNALRIKRDLLTDSRFACLSLESLDGPLG